MFKTEIRTHLYFIYSLQTKKVTNILKVGNIITGNENCVCMHWNARPWGPNFLDPQNIHTGPLEGQ